MNAFYVFWMQISEQPKLVLQHSAREKLVAGMDVSVMTELATNNGFSTKGLMVGIYAHPCFSETYDALNCRSRGIKGKDPVKIIEAATKLLAVVRQSD